MKIITDEITSNSYIAALEICPGDPLGSLNPSAMGHTWKANLSYQLTNATDDNPGSSGLTLGISADDTDANGVVIPHSTALSLGLATFEVDGSNSGHLTDILSISIPGQTRFYSETFSFASYDNSGFQLTNKSSGVAKLTSGTVTVSDVSVTADSRILLTAQETGTSPGILYVSSRTPGTGFTISSTSSTDDALVAYFITEPVQF